MHAVIRPRFPKKAAKGGGTFFIKPRMGRKAQHVPMLLLAAAILPEIILIPLPLLSDGPNMLAGMKLTITALTAGLYRLFAGFAEAE